MKKIALLLLFISTVSLGQNKTKTDKLFSKYDVFISRITDLETNEATIHFSCQNHKYQHITDIFTLFYGSTSDFNKFVDDIRKSFEEEKGTSYDVRDVRFSISSVFKRKILTIYSKDGTKYRIFNEKQFEKVMKGYEKNLSKIK